MTVYLSVSGSVVCQVATSGGRNRIASLRPAIPFLYFSLFPVAIPFNFLFLLHFLRAHFTIPGQLTVNALRLP